MRLADAVQEIRATQRVCRGPRRTTVTLADARRMGPALREALGIPAGELVELALPNVDADTLISALLFESKRKEADALHDILRTGCGRDFNDVIANGPLDGEVHEYACHCGVKGVYRAPLYTLDPE